MNSFSGDPEFRYKGREIVEMLADFTYYPPKKYGYLPVTIKKGDRSDLMSVPPVVRFFIHKYGDTLMAALPHDVLSRENKRPWKEIDHIFLLAMEDANKMPQYKIPLWERFSAYRGVRLGRLNPFGRKKPTK